MANEPYRSQLADEELAVLDQAARVARPIAPVYRGQSSFDQVSQFDQDMEAQNFMVKNARDRIGLLGQTQNMRQSDVDQQRRDEAYVQDQADQEAARNATAAITRKLAGGATLEDALLDIPQEEWGNKHLATAIGNRADFNKIGREEALTKSKLKTALAGDELEQKDIAMKIKYFDDYQSAYESKLKSDATREEAEQWKARTDMMAYQGLQAVENARSPEISDLDTAIQAGDKEALRNYIEDQDFDVSSLDADTAAQIFPDGRTAVMALNGLSYREDKDALRGAIREIAGPLNPEARQKAINKAIAARDKIMRSQNKALRAGTRQENARQALANEKIRQEQLDTKAKELGITKDELEIQEKQKKAGADASEIKGIQGFNTVLKDINKKDDNLGLPAMGSREETAPNARGLLAREGLKKFAQENGIDFEKLWQEKVKAGVDANGLATSVMEEVQKRATSEYRLPAKTTSVTPDKVLPTGKPSLLTADPRKKTP